ncbi:hypothetical protein RZ540_13760, partial [Acinetobacter baumannii]|uniref:hypothetical protein n=1 Tax=Acinetobacter baumannii TaxID=470 RepID=UPI002935B6CF
SLCSKVSNLKVTKATNIAEIEKYIPKREKSSGEYNLDNKGILAAVINCASITPLLNFAAFFKKLIRVLLK